jgi:hypothetical protein
MTGHVINGGCTCTWSWLKKLKRIFSFKKLDEDFFEFLKVKKRYGTMIEKPYRS